MLTFGQFCEVKDLNLSREDWEEYGRQMGWMRAKKVYNTIPSETRKPLVFEKPKEYFNAFSDYQFVMGEDRYYIITSLVANRGFSNRIENTNGVAHDGFDVRVCGWDGKKPIGTVLNKIANFSTDYNGPWNDKDQPAQKAMKHLLTTKVYPFIQKHYKEVDPINGRFK